MYAYPSAVKLREYERIFTGSNQDIGYENPILGFVSDTQRIVFPTDKITYFHYPQTAPSGLLIESDLAIAGAVAGNIPFRADKIWKKMANYITTSIWGDAQPIGKQTGVWLCTWLSGNASEYSIPVWKDRWFNSGYIDQETAMFVASPPSSIIVDIDSQMSFEGGSYYKYFHVGNIHNELIVDTLSGIQDLKVCLEDWAPVTLDESTLGNNGTLINYTPSMVLQQGVNPYEHPNDSCLNLDGINQHCQVLYSSSIALTGDFSYSMWTYAKDWNNIQGNHLLSKNYRGGWNLKYNNGFFTPFVCAVDRNNGNVVVLNTDGKLLLNKTLPAVSNPTHVVVDDDMFIYIVDNGIYQGAKHLYKMDYDGHIVDAVICDSSDDLKGVTIDVRRNVFLSVNNVVSGFYPYDLSKAFQATTIPVAYNNFEYGLTGLYYNYSLNDFCVTNGGDFVEGYTTDREGNFWKLDNSNGFLKYDSDFNFILSGTIGEMTVTSLTGRAIDFTYEFNGTTYQDYAWFINEWEQYFYKYDTSGNFVAKFDLSRFNVHPYGKGDFSGYQRHRKYNYCKYNKQPNIQADLYVCTFPVSAKKYTFSVPTNEISNDDWHLFTFTYDSVNKLARFYMDTVLREIKIIKYPMVYYPYQNPLLLGANVGKITDLDSEMNLSISHFKGKLDDLRIYDYVLNNSDIKHIYLRKFEFTDLKWNMPTGSQSYLEEIERFFKFKLPGLKSPYYNIKLVGLQITDGDTRVLIEDIIRNTIRKIAPSYAELLKITWE